MIEILERFRTSYLGLFTILLITLFFGTSILINPDNLSDFVIRIMGVGSLIKATSVALQLILKCFPDGE